MQVIELDTHHHAEFDRHERLLLGRDETIGFTAIIAIHDTRLGPALGGCRCYPYVDIAAATTDVLRLSRGMSLKSALAGLPLGGGKSVLLADPRAPGKPALMRAMGRFIETLGGTYMAAEDVGTSPADLRLLADETRHAFGIADKTRNGQPASGDPSPQTAAGVELALRAAVKHRLGADNLDGVHIAVQGAGHVGMALIHGLLAGGARVTVADANADRVAELAAMDGVTVTSTADILTVEADVLAPCALGGVLHRSSIEALAVPIVAGAANNQLATPADGVRLAERRIVYVPDFVANAGGIIDIWHETIGYREAAVAAHVGRIADTTRYVLQTAEERSEPTATVAERLAAERLDAVRPADAIQDPPGVAARSNSLASSA